MYTKYFMDIKNKVKTTTVCRFNGELSKKEEWCFGGGS